MNGRLHIIRALMFFCLSLLFLTPKAFNQSVVVHGTVSTAATPVRNASVTFQDISSPSGTYSTLTDSLGRYQLNVTLTSVAPGPSLPAKFTLEQNYPNPFASSTVVPYELNAQSDIHVTIYDILGRVVRNLSAGAQSAGTHSVIWDGRNALGQRVASGVYFYSMQVGGEIQTRKMVLNSSGAGPLELRQEYSSPSPALRDGALSRLQAGVFTVRVENATNTFPSIATSEFDNLVILRDTTLNFLVANQNPVPVAAVYTDSVQQLIRGFGAANILPWRPDMTADQVQKAFGASQGQLGFSILRLRIPYNDDLGEFSAQVPTAKLAQSLGATIFASPWTPPPAMKSNNNIVGGVLNESSYAAYATHLKAFADYMASNGVPLYAVSLQNEPDANVTYESCSWSAGQFLKFMRNNAASIGTRVMMPESQNFVHALSDSTLNDSTAAANVSIIGGHIYGGGLGPYPLAVSKGKEVWMTEHLVLDTTWTGVFGTGMEIKDCMNAGMNAYVWWYIVRYYGPIGEDGAITKRGYVMSQYARFVRPGYLKIKCTSIPQRNVYVTAYRDSTSSRITIVALNTASAPLQQTFSFTSGAITSFTPYTTSTSKNCAQGSSIGFSNGSFTATLDPSSITTFVSN